MKDSAIINWSMIWQRKWRKLFCERCMEKIFLSMDFRMPVLRLRCNYRMQTKTEVIKEVFGFDKIERGLSHIVVQTSHIS